MLYAMLRQFGAKRMYIFVFFYFKIKYSSDEKIDIIIHTLFLALFLGVYHRAGGYL